MPLPSAAETLRTSALDPGQCGAQWQINCAQVFLGASGQRAHAEC